MDRQGAHHVDQGALSNDGRRKQAAMDLSGIGHTGRIEAACRASQGVALEERLRNDVHIHLKNYRKGNPGMHLVSYWEVDTGHVVLGEEVDDTAGLWEDLAIVQGETFHSLDEGHMLRAEAICVVNPEEEGGSE